MHERTHTVPAISGFYLGALTASIFLLLLAEPQNFLWLVLETASAIGTVGLGLPMNWAQSLRVSLCSKGQAEFSRLGLQVGQS